MSNALKNKMLATHIWVVGGRRKLQIYHLTGFTPPNFTLKHFFFIVLIESMPNHCHDQGHVDIGISSQLYPTGESLEIYHLTNVKLAGEGGNNKNIKKDNNNFAK